MCVSQCVPFADTEFLGGGVSCESFDTERSVAFGRSQSVAFGTGQPRLAQVSRVWHGSVAFGMGQLHLALKSQSRLARVSRIWY